MMTGFFKSWRRRIGVVTLMMACLFMAGWVRTFSQEDLVGISFSSQSLVFVESAEQTIGFGMERGNGRPIWDIFPFWQTSPSSRVKPLDDIQHVKWGVQWHDFGIGGNDQDYPDNLLLEVHAPYSFFVLPLTLISLWLFCSPSQEHRLRRSSLTPI